MYKKQMLIQRIVCFAVLAAAVLVFLYSLSLCTDLHYYNFAYYAENPNRPKFEGANIYNDIQPFNKQLTTAGIILVITAVAIFIFGSHKRRKYYIGNYVTIGINSALALGVSVWGILNVMKYRAMYDLIDFDGERGFNYYQTEFFGQDADITPFWFDIGYFVFAVVILITVLSLASLAFKICVMRGERKLLKEGGN